MDTSWVEVHAAVVGPVLDFRLGHLSFSRVVVGSCRLRVACCIEFRMVVAAPDRLPAVLDSLAVPMRRN